MAAGIAPGIAGAAGGAPAAGLRAADTAGEEQQTGTVLLMAALALTVVVHGGLLPFTHGNTYDAYIHMFFGDHYHRSWFDPWEPRWYTGFATTSYPPGTHMAIALLMQVMPLRAAFCVTMLGGLLLLTLGIYRFALLWVPPRAAGYAALAGVLASSVSETVHLFGQLPTICSLGLFLNGLPWVYRWIVAGGPGNLGAALALGAATTAAHHVTTLFGAVFFVIPLGLQALRSAHELARRGPRRAGAGALLAPLGWPVLRGLVLAVLLVGVMVGTIFPYWHWSVTDPITQVSIPHGSRESFIARPDLGLVFFVMPWGAGLLALPYALVKGFATRAWPLAGSVALCFVLGTGGTTPIPRLLLRGAFDILTLDRFTFWASILILPLAGLMVDGLLHGRSGRLIGAALGRGLRCALIAGLFLAQVGGAVFCAMLPALRPVQPRHVDPAPILAFLEQDEHDRWRYLTLGFGDQFAYLSALTTAQSVDGNYHSARRLPDMTLFSVERLENSKYLGVPGLGSLQQFLVNADRYHLKYVFSNDAFYDPLLTFTGWNQLNRLPNGVVIWEKPDVTPLPRLLPRRDLPVLHRLIWGIAPPAALGLAALVLGGAALRRGFARPRPEDRPVLRPTDEFRHPARLRRVVIGAALLLALGAGWGGWRLARAMAAPAPPEAVIAGYFGDLDFRRFRAAYDRLDPASRGSFDAAGFPWRWRGGLIASYGKLLAVRPRPVLAGPDAIDWEVELDWLSALDVQTERLTLRTLRRNGVWVIAPDALRQVQTPLRIARAPGVSWAQPGRRQPRPETDLHADRLDRPRLAPGPARLVRHDGRYSVVGSLFVEDADPAQITVTARLRAADGTVLAERAAGQVHSQRLLPGESGVYRVAFDGVLSLKDAAAQGGFDPRLSIPPVLAAAPAGADVAARALVGAQNLYRGIALNGVTAQELPDGLEVRGMAVNTGTETASVVRIIAVLADAGGVPVWAEPHYVQSNILPGQSAPFALRLPPRAAITVLADLPAAGIEVNGAGRSDETAGGAAAASAALRAGAVTLAGAAGHDLLRLEVSAMTFDPEF